MSGVDIDKLFSQSTVNVDKIFKQRRPECLCCLKDERRCICPTCPTCNRTGNFRCYQVHGLGGTHAQVVSRATWTVAHYEERIIFYQQQLEEAKEFVEELKLNTSLVYKGE